LEVDRDFLEPFRNKTRRGASIGLGKLIEQATRLAAYDRREKTLEMRRYLIAETLKTQGPDGYIGCLAEGSRMKELWDLPEMGFIILGLVVDYRLFGENASLEAARRAADYILRKWDTLPPDWGTHGVADVPSCTGLCYALLTLYAETRDTRYPAFCLKQRYMADWDLDIVIGRRKNLDAHIYTYLDQCVVQLELYRSQRNRRLLRPALRAMRFLREGDGACITGGAGIWECWTNDQDGRKALAETCASAYQIRVYDSLLRLDGDAAYGDLMERTIYNTLFAAQEPNGRRIRYYSPFEGPREFYPGDTYCCPNNYRRILAELPMMLYYEADRGVAVNLYSESEARLTVAEKVKLTLRQETDYPTSGKVTLILDPETSARFPLKLRIPQWCETASVAVNGQAANVTIRPGRFVELNRMWRAGDRVTLDLPMTWRVVAGRRRQSGRAAVMRGPLVYAFNPATVTGLKPSQQKVFADDAAAIGATLMIDPASIRDAGPDTTVRPQGTACTVLASPGGHAVGVTEKNAVRIRLTEFADPDAELTYFRLPDLAPAVPDELFSGPRK
ncbi:MAG: glycoside hydrolase family 127 protein, partial [Kiritimatiellia bacterium]|nr:glycoside hydrolase family 127 protein [Kiritimatiellia bacterium]